MIKRTLYLKLWQELSSEKQMIFISGPRQVGKTTFTREIAREFKNQLYFNWDIIANKRRLIEDPAFFEHMNRVDESSPLVIFDEIHKYKQWKNYLKGVYDEFHQKYKFIVSGSGRLDIHQKGGDSLAGRYFEFHLFPFTVAELAGQNRPFKEFHKSPLSGFSFNGRKRSKDIWEQLSVTGGFPEPFVKGTKTFWTKWSANYARQIIREDLRSITDLRNVDATEILFSLLPSKVGSPFSINNVAGDLQVTFESIKSWLLLFDMFYLTFRISPWTSKIARAILKEKKLYLFNYAEIQDEGSKFENMVAVELLRAVRHWNEYGYGRFSLHYVRNKDKAEVDFLIAERNSPVLLIETKVSDDVPAVSLKEFQNVLNVPAVQLVNKENIFKIAKNGSNQILVITAHQWLASLP